MKIYFLKRKGKTTLGNMPLFKEITINEKIKMFADLHFYRKKDVKAYFETFMYPEFYEIASAEIK